MIGTGILSRFREVLLNIYDPVNGGIDVNIQSQTSPLLQYFLMNEIKDDITLTSPVSVDDTVINVSAGHGFGSAVAGERLVIWENSRFTQVIVNSVAVNALTIEMPISSAFTVDAVVVRGNILMNIDGNASPTDFIMKMRNFTIPIDVSKAIITMQHGANVPDAGKFGGLSALAKGVYFRKENTIKFSLGNYRTNQDFDDNGGKVEYSDKAPAGTNATKITYDIEEIFGQVIRIDPRSNDIILGHVRDDIDSGSGMAKMTTSIIGSYTRGE
jgi:hypothetical protein